MQKSNNLLSIVMCALAVISVCLNVFLVTTQRHPTPTPATLPATQPAYKLYIVIPNDVTDTDSYIHQLEAILADRVPGFTMYPTRGGASQDDGSVIYQTTLVCELYGTDADTVQAISHEAMATFGIPTVPVASSFSQWQIIQ